MSVAGPNFPMDTTWQRLILLSLSKKQPKQKFQTQARPSLVAGFWWLSGCTVAPAAFWKSIFWDTQYLCAIAANQLFFKVFAWSSWWPKLWLKLNRKYMKVVVQLGPRLAQRMDLRTLPVPLDKRPFRRASSLGWRLAELCGLTGWWKKQATLRKGAEWK